MKSNFQINFRTIKNIFEVLPRLTIYYDESEHWISWILSLAWGTFELEIILNKYKNEKDNSNSNNIFFV